MKHFAALALLAVVAAPPALAQTAAQPATTATKGTGRASGQLLDAATQKPVEYATVVLSPPGVWFPWARLRSGEGTAGAAGMVAQLCTEKTTACSAQLADVATFLQNTTYP